MGGSINKVVVNKPIDVATRSTVEFITANIPEGASILEVGCGAGEVALELGRLGFKVTGVDRDDEVVSIARTRGVNAETVSWPEYSCETVDAIVFTRSLHHIERLQDSILRSKEVLKPDGKLLVEDFAFDRADQPTMEWFLSVLRSPELRAAIEPVPGEFVTKLLASQDPLAEWRSNNHHDLHSFDAITEAIPSHFDIRETYEVPYLYRYLVPVLSESPDAATFVEETFREETRLCEATDILFIGRRVLAESRFEK